MILKHVNHDNPVILSKQHGSYPHVHSCAKRGRRTNWCGERGEPVGAHRGTNGQDARAPQSPTRGAICVPRVELYVSHAWDRHGSTRGTGQVPSVKRAGRHGKRMPGGLLERQLPFKRVKTAVGPFISTLGACLALPFGASQACPAESLKYETPSVSSMRLYRSQV